MRTIVFYEYDRDMDHSMGEITEEEYQKLLPFKEVVEDCGTIPDEIETLVWETIGNRCASILSEDLPQDADIWIKVC